MPVIVKINDAVLDHYLNMPDGQVGKYLSKKGTLIVTAARAQVGKRTGRLALSIHKRQMRVGRYQQLRVGSVVNYALAHHEGTKPHMIVAKDAQMLRFTSGSRVIYTRMVRHPGTRANKYLSDNLRLAL